MTTETLAQLSDDLMSSATAVYALALLAYAANLAVGRRAEPAEHPSEMDLPALVGVGGPQGPPTNAAKGGNVTASDISPQGRLSGERIEGVAYALTVLGFALHLAASATRGLAADRPPWGNMYEFATTGALAATAAFLVTARLARLRGLGVVVVGVVLLTLGLSVTVLYTPVGPLVPALNSYWLVIHVAAAIISAGVFTVGAATTVLYLVRRRSDRLGRVSRLPSTPALDEVARAAHTFAFPIWTFAVIAGAIWAENAWGRYWGWDPKETWAFVTWVVYAAHLHARATAGWRGRAAAWLALLGYLALLFNFFGVNMWITGLHSYAGI